MEEKELNVAVVLEDNTDVNTLGAGLYYFDSPLRNAPSDIEFGGFIHLNIVISPFTLKKFEHLGYFPPEYDGTDDFRPKFYHRQINDDGTKEEWVLMGVG